MGFKDMHLARLAVSAGLVAALGGIAVAPVAAVADEVAVGQDVAVDQDAAQPDSDGSNDAESGDAATASVVATIGSASFDSLKAAFDAAKSGDIIKLAANADISDGSQTLVVSKSKDVTFDLAGYDLKLANTEAGRILVYGHLVLMDSTDTAKNGTGQGSIYTDTVYTGGPTGYALIDAVGGEFVMESGLIDSASGIENNASKGQFAVGVENSAGDASVVINGGRIVAGWYAVSGNGNNKVYVGNITVNGGILESVADYAIYSPQHGTTTINGGVVYGAAGAVDIKRGSLLVNGGTVTSKDQGDTGEWGDGTGGDKNAALHVHPRYGNVFVRVSGGNISAEKNSIAIETGDAAKYATTVKVYGGTFNKEIDSSFLGAGHVQAEEAGKFKVSGPAKESSVAEVGGHYYATLQDAVYAADNGETVTLSKSIAGSEISSESQYLKFVNCGQSMTLDLAGNTVTNNAGDTVSVLGASNCNLTIKNGVFENSHADGYGLYVYAENEGAGRLNSDNATITLDGVTFKTKDQAVGANGMNSSCNVTLKNCKLDCPETLGVYWPVQSGVLTIDNTVIDSKSGVTVKGGTVNIKGSNTSIAARGEKVVPDDYYDGNPNKNLVLTGDAIYVESGYNERPIELNIEAGTFKSDNASALNFFQKEGEQAPERKIVVKGGSFSSDPSDYVADGYDIVESNGMFNVSKHEEPIVPPAGGGGSTTPSDKTEVEKNPDGSTTTTVTKPDGSQTITHETATGTESVVKKDEDGNVTSTEVIVSKEDAESGKVELPLADAEPGPDVDKAPEVEIKVPASVSEKAPVQVTVPVAKGQGAEPDYGVVVFAVDADGSETVIPKCTVDKDGNVVFEATGDVTIKVVDNAKDMPDVTDADWFAGDVVDFATARGIVNGVDMPDGTKEFQGYGKTSRGMFVAMLHNLESNPEAASGDSLADVPEGAFYADAAAWALEEGILSGVDMPEGSKQFQGEADVTREQVAVFLMRYAQYLGMDVSARAEIDFPDAGEVSGFARDAMSWAVANGLFTGDDVTGELNPADGAARAEVATVLMRFINLMYA